MQVKVEPCAGTELWRLAEEEGWLVIPPEGGPQMAQAYAPTPWLTVRELALEKGVLPADELERALDARAQTEGGVRSD